VPVLAVAESQNVDASNQLTDVYEITYTIPGRPGSFTVNVPKNADALAAAEAEINSLTEQVNSIYNIP
jgi:hypothetical protein